MTATAEHWPADGNALDPQTGGTVLIGGTYRLNGARPHPLLDGLPDVVHLPARVGASSDVRAVVDLVRRGKAEALMKGSLHTDELMGAVGRLVRR